MIIDLKKGELGLMSRLGFNTVNIFQKKYFFELNVRNTSGTTFNEKKVHNRMS